VKNGCAFVHFLEIDLAMRNGGIFIPFLFAQYAIGSVGCCFPGFLHSCTNGAYRAVFTSSHSRSVRRERNEFRSIPVLTGVFILLSHSSTSIDLYIHFLIPDITSAGFNHGISDDRSIFIICSVLLLP